MDTMTQEVMRHRISRIGSHRRAHRRPIEAETLSFPAPRPVVVRPAPEVRIIRVSPLPHALWIVGGWLLAGVAGVMLGVGIAQHWG